MPGVPMIAILISSHFDSLQSRPADEETFLVAKTSPLISPAPHSYHSLYLLQDPACSQMVSSALTPQWIKSLCMIPSDKIGSFPRTYPGVCPAGTQKKRSYVLFQKHLKELYISYFEETWPLKNIIQPTQVTTKPSRDK